MAKIQRKSAKIFAENAAAGIGGVSQFGSLATGNPNYSKDVDVIQALQAYQLGWSSAVTGNKSPAIEDRNALDYLLSYQQAYIMQRGVPEWIATETYYKGSFVSKDDGKMYVSTIDDNTGNDPETDSVNWIAFPTPSEVNAKVAKAGDTMTGALNVQSTISATGLISAQTPNIADNNNNLATTSWVRSLLSANQANGLATFFRNGNGYVKFSNGLIIQWGFNTIPTNQAVSISFAIPFSDTNYRVVVSPFTSANAAGNKRDFYWADYYRTTAFNIVASYESIGTATFTWIAIGF